MVVKCNISTSDQKFEDRKTRLPPIPSFVVPAFRAFAEIVKWTEVFCMDVVWSLPLRSIPCSIVVFQFRMCGRDTIRYVIFNVRYITDGQPT